MLVRKQDLRMKRLQPSSGLPEASDRLIVSVCWALQSLSLGKACASPATKRPVRLSSPKGGQRSTSPLWDPTNSRSEATALLTVPSLSAPSGPGRFLKENPDKFTQRAEISGAL